MPQIPFQELICLNIRERASCLNNIAKNIHLDRDEPDEVLRSSRKMKQVIDLYLDEYFEWELSKHVELINNIPEKELFIQKVFDIAESYIVNMQRKIDESNGPFKNLFGVSGANILAGMQTRTRIITENLGHNFEKMACVSPTCLSPEDFFGVKLVGVDIITRVRGIGNLFIQLKTAEDTLTGSQAPRARKELEIYDNPYFAAAIKLNHTWTIGGINTISNHGITRIRGQEFWSLINIPYEIILSAVSMMMVDIEEYVLNIEDSDTDQQISLDI